MIFCVCSFYLQRLFVGGIAPLAGAPLPAGVAEIPPNAFGAFLSRQNGFVDRSCGSGLLFKVANLHDVDKASLAIRRSVQFVRLGTIVTGMMGLDVQLPLICVYLLTSMTKSEQLLEGFNLGG